MSNPDLTKTDEFVKDLGERAAKTFVQTLVAVTPGLYALSGIHVASVQSIPELAKPLLGVAAGAGAAALSAAWNTTVAYLKANKADEVGLVDADEAAIEQKFKNSGVTV